MYPTPNRTPAQEAAEDIFFGQIVIIWARWFFIAAGAVLALWSASTVLELTGAILIVVALMAINFFVHGRYLMERPANRLFLLGTSLLDLTIITLLLVNWQGKVGLESPFFILYYPILFSFALVFPPRLTGIYTLIVLALYVGVCLGLNPRIVTEINLINSLLTKLITLAAMSGLGTFYWRIQRDQRRAVIGPAKPVASRS